MVGNEARGGAALLPCRAAPPRATAVAASAGEDARLTEAQARDESAGETLQLRAESQAMTLTARFDPADHATERGTRVDFTVRRPVESPTTFAGTLKRYLAQ